MPLQDGLRAQRVDVAAHGLRRHREPLGQGIDADEALLAHEIDDLRATLLLPAKRPASRRHCVRKRTWHRPWPAQGENR